MKKMFQSMKNFVLETFLSANVRFFLAIMTILQILPSMVWQDEGGRMGRPLHKKHQTSYHKKPDATPILKFNY